ncbi:MAG: hypothetical protein HYT69_01355 [Candidatus Zambryskibacteria bacterium]|nr:hypothetical protein [Candidatus Zambryskibacteria bacterium]
MEEPREEKSNPSTPLDKARDKPLGASPSSLKQIRTFQGDVATALEQQKESLVSIQRTEAAKRGGTTPSSDSNARGHSSVFFFGGFLLIALGSVGGYLAYNEFLRKTAPPAIAAPESRFISAEMSEELDVSDVSRESLILKINDSAAEIPRAGVKHLIINTTSAEFLKMLETRAPGNLVRALDPLFMLGAYRAPGSIAGDESRFVIFKLASFENAFAGMLNWEQNLAEDLGPLFSTAPLLQSIDFESVFKDVVSKNKDVRVLSAAEEPIILYSFFDNRMLIITEDLETLQILIERLTRELLSR